MKAAYAKYRLDFIVPGGTSRGVLTHKDTYFLKIWEPDAPDKFGIGEFGRPGDRLGGLFVDRVWF